MYASGKGMPQDRVTAYMWLELAAAAGNPDALRDADALARQMTPSQIAEAQKLAHDWKPKTNY
jgi:hypothetical protein